MNAIAVPRSTMDGLQKSRYLHEMIDLLKRYLASDPAPEEDPKKRIHLATCALFIEIAHADDEFSAEERSHISEVFRDRYGLSQADLDSLMEEAQASFRGSIDLWQFTSVIDQNCTREEKITILELLWEIVFADGHLASHEEYLTRKVSELLGLSHREFIDAKLKAVRARSNT